jgi:hypothetical protein
MGYADPTTQAFTLIGQAMRLINNVDGISKEWIKLYNVREDMIAAAHPASGSPQYWDAE